MDAFSTKVEAKHNWAEELKPLLKKYKELKLLRMFNFT